MQYPRNVGPDTGCVLLSISLELSQSPRAAIGIPCELSQDLEQVIGMMKK